jgi:PTH1 family peptidyl-tRNA hydrolase
MYVVTGLGNPGKKYDSTRHNIGFEVLAELARRYGGGKPKVRFEAETVEITAGSARLLLVAPQTFMNLSGRSVRQVVDFYQLPLERLLVVSDDLNLPLGKLRLRGSGSAGGQKGLANIIQHLGTEDFARLRIGIAAPPGEMDAADYVLSRFHAAERETVIAAVNRAADAVECWAEQGLAAAMNQFNSEGRGARDEGRGEARDEG